MVLRVGLVACCLNTEHIRGMGKYVFELVQQSGPQHATEWYLFADNPRYGLTAPENKPVIKDVFTFRGDRFRLWEQLGLPLRTIKHNVDVLHCTEGMLPLWQAKPTVVTVHDTLPWEIRADTLTNRIYYDLVQPAALKKSAAIITGSQSAKTDILARWPWLEDKITVIPHGIEDAYFTNELFKLPDDLQSAMGDDAYMVYLGGPLERKRFSWALEVLARTQYKSLQLVACGFNSEARRVAMDKLPNNLRNRVHFASYLSDAEIRSLYRGAKAALYPTLYEGFGFPAVEAQAAGVPVLFSPLGSLKELIGPLAMMVPAEDMDAWLAAVTEAMNLGEHRAERANRASVWAKQFAWKESFEKHLAIYRRAAKV